MHLGRRLQTRQKGFFENKVTQMIPGIHVVHRMVDENLHIRLRMICPNTKKFPWAVGFPENQSPISLHIRIAFHGHVQLRIGFKHLEWSEQLEQATLEFCNYLGLQIMQCC
jgi:hypothetical protein